MTGEAADSYRCIVDDFGALHLEELLDSQEPLEGSQTVILTSLREALAALKRISPEGLTSTQLELSTRVNAVLGTTPF